MVAQLSSTLDVVSRLYLNGFRFSIDDFGTGYSNLDQLKQLPLSELKIDRSLVIGAMQDKAGRAILASSIQLGHALGVKVVAEGVETLEDWAMSTMEESMVAISTPSVTMASVIHRRCGESWTPLTLNPDHPEWG